MDVKSLRNEMKTKRLNLTAEDVKALSLAVYNNFFTLDFIKEKSNFFIYNSIKNEVDTKEIIKTLSLIGKTISYPVTIKDIMLSAIPKNHKTVIGNFDIIEPENYSIMEKVDVAIVPLIACDNQKNRVGFGKGFYDRFLSKTPCIKIGLAYDFQVVNNITPNSWDVPLDIIITPTKIIT